MKMWFLEDPLDTADVEDDELISHVPQKVLNTKAEKERLRDVQLRRSV